MAERISPKAQPGSLLKGNQPKHVARDKRESKPDHLALIRKAPCVSCDADPCGEAAHVRMSAHGKPVTGTGIRPNDGWAVPLCHACHMKQHATGERKFWSDLGLDPIALTVELAGARNFSQMRAIVLLAKGRRR